MLDLCKKAYGSPILDVLIMEEDAIRTSTPFDEETQEKTLFDSIVFG